MKIFNLVRSSLNFLNREPKCFRVFLFAVEFFTQELIKVFYTSLIILLLLKQSLFVWAVPKT